MKAHLGQAKSERIDCGAEANEGRHNRRQILNIRTQTRQERQREREKAADGSLKAFQCTCTRNNTSWLVQF